MVHYLPESRSSGMLFDYVLFMRLWVNGVNPVWKGLCICTVGLLLHVQAKVKPYS